MDNIILSFLKYASGFIDNVIVLYFVIKFFRFKESVKYKYLYSSILLVITFFILYVVKFYPTLNVLLTIAVLFCFYIFSLLFLKDEYWLKAFFIFAIYAVFVVFSLLVYNVATFFVTDIDGPRHDLYMSAIYLVRNFLSIISIEYFFVLIRKKELFFRRTEKIILLAFFMFSIIMSVYLTFVMHTNARASYLLFIISTMIATVLIYFLLGNAAKKNEELRKMELIELANKNLNIQIEQIVNQWLEIKKLKHDMSNSFLTLKKLARDGRNEELCQYVDQIIPLATVDDSTEKWCENYHINAVLANKKRECEQKNIRFLPCISCDSTQLNGYQCSRILFNLLDNAIEACEKLPAGNKLIYLTMNDFSPIYVNLKIINPIKETVITNKFATTKENSKDHGLGHQIVEDILKENQGMIEYYEEQSEFIAHALIRK